MLGALSPSRAGDFMTCPLLYRFRTIDRLPEAPSPDAVRGTLVHKVLEDLFDLPAADRTPERARDLLVPAWDALLEAEPELPRCSTPPRAPDVRRPGSARCREVLDRYFTLEDPRRLEPAERELYVEALLDSRLLLRGFVDRIDVAPTARSGSSTTRPGARPGELFEAKALFQMKFYALVIWRTRGVVPPMLQLVYLGNGEMLRYEPDEADLLATERKVEAIWRAIRRAEETGDWRPNRSRLCDWCAHQAHLPGVRRHAAAAADPPRAGADGRRPRRPTRLAAASPEVSQSRCARPRARPGCGRRRRSVAKTEVRCALTVRSVMPSRRAICLLARPCRTSASTSRLPRRQVGHGRRRRPRGCRAARGPPAGGSATRRGPRRGCPSRTSSGSASLSR